MYIASFCFFVIFLFKLRSHSAKKHSWATSMHWDFMSEYWMYFVGSVLCLAAPTVLSVGITTIYADAPLQTISTGPALLN